MDDFKWRNGYILYELLWCTSGRSTSAVLSPVVSNHCLGTLLHQCLTDCWYKIASRTRRGGGSQTVWVCWEVSVGEGLSQFWPHVLFRVRYRQCRRNAESPHWMLTRLTSRRPSPSSATAASGLGGRRIRRGPWQARPVCLSSLLAPASTERGPPASPW